MSSVILDEQMVARVVASRVEGLSLRWIDWHLPTRRDFCSTLSLRERRLNVAS